MKNLLFVALLLMSLSTFGQSLNQHLEFVGNPIQLGDTTIMEVKAKRSRDFVVISPDNKVTLSSGKALTAFQARQSLNRLKAYRRVVSR